MLKRLILVIAALWMPLSAAASPELARDWGKSAAQLGQKTGDLIRAVDQGQTLQLDERYALNVYRFGRTSGTLGAWIDQSDGPKDLGCIFRGMSAEAETQLEVLEGAGDVEAQRASLVRLASVFADAEMIASAAQSRAPTPGLGPVRTTSSCAARASDVLELLN